MRNTSLRSVPEIADVVLHFALSPREMWQEIGLSRVGI